MNTSDDMDQNDTESKIVTVNFHGATLASLLGSTPDTTEVAMKPIVEGMRLDWTAQYRKLLSHPVLAACVAVKTMQMPGDSQAREHVFLRLTRLPFWMATIHPDRVKDAARHDACGAPSGALAVSTAGSPSPSHLNPLSLSIRNP